MSDKIRVILVDDHEDSQDVLRAFLIMHDDIEVVATAENADNAVKRILEYLPDVVFLDVQMPGKSGLDVLNELKRSGYVPNIIFTTGYHDYAIQAIRERAFDYLLKPIDGEELDKCLARLRIAMKKNDSEVALFGKTSVSPARLRFNTRSGYMLIDPDDIVYCKASHNYTEIFTSEKDKETVTVQLGKIEPLLSETSLKRVGKSFIVNTRYVKEVDRRHEYCVFRKHGETFKISLSANYLKQLDEAMR